MGRQAPDNQAPLSDRACRLAAGPYDVCAYDLCRVERDLGVGTVADRLLVDLGMDGRVSVGTSLDGELPTIGEPGELAWPLDGEALGDLRWYLEDYLRAPFGVWEDRGPRLEAALAGWGQAVFSSVFGSGPARDAYVKVRARRGPAELVFRSASPGLLGLPWELMRDPDRPTPLALDLAGVSRSLPSGQLAETVEVPGGKLRVLMVISRPRGTRDVGYQMIARPLLRRLEAVRGEVDLVVLRPPTLDALAETLTEATAQGEPFQVVHFDGHGVLQGPEAEGALVFQRPRGGADLVSAAKVALVLKAAQVPVVVLNACQSGAIGKDLEAAIATRLLAEGTASVVAMAYSVYAVAAAEFMAAFYERLFAGGPVSAAVTAGRQRMFTSNGRPSPKGDLPLADWVVPVHYLRRDVSFPQACTRRGTPLSLDAQLDKLRRAAPDADGAGELAPVGTFTGRDALYYQLEVAARLQRVVVLYGQGGTGKTELAKAFGRWWRDTGGVTEPRFVFVHSFEPGVATFGLDGVIDQVGLRLFGQDFALRDTADRRAVVENVLAEHRMLLIWDSFETVASMPDPMAATRPLGEDERRELADFLDRLAAGGRSAVLITSRTTEDWLGDVRRIEVGGLTSREADEYAGYLLEPYPAAAPRRARRAFGELMEWLDGHPLSMRLILPWLDKAEPEALLAGLRGATPLPGRQGTKESRTTSLPASVSYSFDHLRDVTRRLLPAVCLFHAVAVADVLVAFSQVRGAPGRFRGMTKQHWVEALDDATRVGLLTDLGGSMYRIHPALPGYLAAEWRREDPENHDAVRDAATEALLAAHAAQARWLFGRSGKARLADVVIGLERRTLGSLLGYALDHGLWANALAIAVVLNTYWTARDLNEEADAWADRARLAIEDPDGAPPQLSTPEGLLWMHFVGRQAERQLVRHHLDDSERTYQQILFMLQAQPASRHQQLLCAECFQYLGRVAQLRGRLDEAEDWHRKSLAIKEVLGDEPGSADTYWQLGLVAQYRGLMNEAEDWYRKSLAILRELGNKPGMANSYHQLGRVAQLQGHLDAAEDWYREALAILRELGDKPNIARTCHQLGCVAEDRGRLDQAEDWYRKSLVLKEELGDKPGMVSTYHQLGTIAYLRGRLDEAEDWCRKSLAIMEELDHKPHITASWHQLGMIAQDRGLLDDAEAWYRKALVLGKELGDKLGMARSHHQLGMIAQDRGLLDDAEAWYRKALAINDDLDNKPGMALSFGQLGLLAENRGQPRQALEWTIRSVVLFREFPHPATGPAPSHLARLTTKLGTGGLEECWQRVTGGLLPRAIRSYIEHPEHGEGKGAPNDR